MLKTLNFVPLVSLGRICLPRKSAEESVTILLNFVGFKSRNFSLHACALYDSSYNRLLFLALLLSDDLRFHLRTSYTFCRISTLVSDEDLKGLIEKLEERNEDAEIWENIIQKSNPRVSYTAKSCKPKVIASYNLSSVSSKLLLTESIYALAACRMVVL